VNNAKTAEMIIISAVFIKERKKGSKRKEVHNNERKDVKDVKEFFTFF
jgi:hypothetical protein